MMVYSLIKLSWSDIFADLNIVGKIIFFPLFLVCSICAAVGAIFEFVFFDILVLIIFAFSKSMDVSDVLDFMLDRE